MAGEMNLSTLLSSLTGTLHAEIYVFVTLAERKIPDGIVTRMVFEEAEGTSLIVTLDQAAKFELEYEFPSRMITLNVHSSLEAVGFMAVIATELAKEGMGVNPVAGFFHDHIFVPDGREQDALDVLARIADENSKTSG